MKLSDCSDYIPGNVSHRDLRVAYNSIGGCATVNHLHFHTYYLKHKLFIETAVSVLLDSKLLFYIMCL